MNFEFTEEQTQLVDGLKKFISKECGFEERQRIIHSPTGESEKIWKGLVDLGLLALPVSEEFGGFSATGVDMLVVMQEFGRGLMVGPYFSTVWGTHFIEHIARDEVKKKLLPAITEGKCKIAVALLELHSRYDLAQVESKAEIKEDAYLLSGQKSFVLGGGTADYFIISARVSGQAGEQEGLSLFVVPRGAQGLMVQDYRIIDGYRAAEVKFDHVSVPKENLLGVENMAWESIEKGVDYAIMLLCAQAVGAMDAMCNQTIEYSKSRKQFGQPIGKFQALQHRMVDMLIHLEQARSMAYLASIKIMSEDSIERRRFLSAAKVRVGQASKFIAQQSVQTYGGMGVSDEVAISHYFKRLTAIELILGDIDFHLDRFIKSDA